MQRQDKARLLPGGSQTLIRVAHKHELAKTQLAALGRQPAARGSRQQQQRRFSDVGQGAGQMLLGRHDPRLQARRVSCLPTITTAVTTMPTISHAQYLAPPAPKEPVQFGARPPPGHAVARPEPIRVIEPDARLCDEKNTSVDSNETLKDNSEVEEEEEKEEDEREKKETDVVEEEEKPMENAEWCEFLDSQLEEMMAELEEGAGCLDSVDNQNFLAMLVGPLPNSRTDSVVLHKLCRLLSLPLATQRPDSPAISSLLQAFHTKRLVHYLVVALVVQGRQEEEEEESNGLAALTCLLVRLTTCSPAMAVHLQQAIAPQARQEVLVGLLGRRDGRVVADVLAILSRLVSMHGLGKATVASIPGQLERLLAVGNKKEELILGRALTLLGLLVHTDPEACRPHVTNFLAACRSEGRGWGKHTLGAANSVSCAILDMSGG